MSRIGKMPIVVPAGVEVKNDNNCITVKGPKGELTKQFSTVLTINVEPGVITVTRPNDEKTNRSLHGLTRTLIANMVEGVTNGYSKTLEIEGVGYRAAKSGKQVNLNLGFSHPVVFEETDTIKLDVPAPNKIIVAIGKRLKFLLSEVRGDLTSSFFEVSSVLGISSSMGLFVSSLTAFFSAKV